MIKKDMENIIHQVMLQIYKDTGVKVTSLTVNWIDVSSLEGPAFIIGGVQVQTIPQLPAKEVPEPQEKGETTAETTETCG